jgi:hypothetical protein
MAQKHPGYEEVLSAMKQIGSTKNSKKNLYVTYGHMEKKKSLEKRKN